MNDYQMYVLKHNTHSYTQQAALIGLAAEVGEVASLLQKSDYKHTEVDREALLLELGDVLYYLTFFCAVAGTSLEEIRLMNVDKLDKRRREAIEKHISELEEQLEHHYSRKVEKELERLRKALEDETKDAESRASQI